MHPVRRLGEDFDWREYLEWEEIADDILERVRRGLEHWCEDIQDDPLECYYAHASMDPYEILLVYSGAREDVLRRMPESTYKSLEAALTSFIERKIRVWERRARAWWRG